MMNPSHGWLMGWFITALILDLLKEPPKIYHIPPKKTKNMEWIFHWKNNKSSSAKPSKAV
jgi:hypothetical protein